jgi:hypothetical protein
VPEPKLCGECGAIHRPGENTLCPGWRPGPFVPDPPERAIIYPINITLGAVRRALAYHGLHVVSEADKRVLDACSAAGLGMTAQGELTIASGEAAIAEAESAKRLARRGEKA